MTPLLRHPTVLYKPVLSYAAAVLIDYVAHILGAPKDDSKKQTKATEEVQRCQVLLMIGDYGPHFLYKHAQTMWDQASWYPCEVPRKPLSDCLEESSIVLLGDTSDRNSKHWSQVSKPSIGPKYRPSKRMLNSSRRSPNGFRKLCEGARRLSPTSFVHVRRESEIHSHRSSTGLDVFASLQ